VAATPRLPLGPPRGPGRAVRGLSGWVLLDSFTDRDSKCESIQATPRLGVASGAETRRFAPSTDVRFLFVQKMSSWGVFRAAHPSLAAFGVERLGGPPAYLATVRSDGAPRVHPVTPIIGGDHLFLFMEPTSTKGRDLR
jgi:hypothetical protein